MKSRLAASISSLLLASCFSQAPVKYQSSPVLMPPEETPPAPEKVEPIQNPPEQALFPEEEKKEEKPIQCCPENMASIEDLYCIDRYEASIVDKTTGEDASPHYIASLQGLYSARWQYDSFKTKEIDQDLLPRLVQESQPLLMPARGAEQFSSFEPKAVAIPVKIPAGYVNKIIAGQACANAGKRLCTRKEWYKTCVGPEGPSPYFDAKGKEIFPEFYPYGAAYEEGKCNMGLQPGRWPPGLLGRKNNEEMLDPRIGALLGKDGLPMKRENGAFPGCRNEYGVYNLLGNIHEIVADTYIAKRFPRKRVMFVGSHYVRSEKQSCAEATTGHGDKYTDYSVGFRCCMNLQH